MVTLRTLHAKNQPPKQKIVAYRQITDRHTDTQTDTQRKQTVRTPFSIFFLVFDFLLKEQSEKSYGVEEILQLEVTPFNVKYIDQDREFFFFIYRENKNETEIFLHQRNK